MKYYCAYLAAGVFLCLNLSAQVRTQAEEEDNQQAQRERWFYEQRRFPLGHIPTGARTSAIEEIKRRAKPRDVTTNSSNWTLIGPQPTDQDSNYPTAGRVNAIAIDPRNNNVVYIGAAEGGVWKTTDGGVTWTPLTDDQPSLASRLAAPGSSQSGHALRGHGRREFHAGQLLRRGHFKVYRRRRHLDQSGGAISARTNWVASTESGFEDTAVHDRVGSLAVG
jgi:hypothetical protein